ncbi:MAG: M23 family metallopeptidase [Desulfohalobiaceae bacterium]
MKNETGKTRALLLVLVLLILGLGGVYMFNAERDAPELDIEPAGGFINAQSSIQVAARDEGSGLAEVRVTVVQDDKEHKIQEEALEPETRQWQQELDLKGLELRDQELTLKFQARDRSWANLFQGNKSLQEQEFELDTSPPDVSLQTFVHNLNQGGSGVVGFVLSEPVEKAGVEVGETFFPAYEVQENRYLCFFSFPYSLQPGEDRPVILAQDRAGNSRSAGFNLHVNSRSFPNSEVQVSEDFIQNTLLQFSDLYPEAKSDLDLFLAVNQDLRQENRERLREIGRDTAKAPLWSGKFLRQPNASRMSGFGRKRSYLFQGKEVDEQTHLGVDLASTSRAEVPAANSGRVVFADRLGIYGKTVILDHGLGLQSMYAHLSQVQVEEGDMLQKADTLGRTGATGLAAGDHLHFEIMIAGFPVDPTEWWDAKWIQNNVQPKLGLATE